VTAKSETGLSSAVMREPASGGPPRKVAGAVAAHPKPRALRIRFTAASIGSPKRLRFAAEATQMNGCPPPRGCVDRAPNRARTQAFELRSVSSR
jgi:hypothetical protein